MRRPTLLALLILATVTPTGVDADAGDAQHAVAANHYAAGRWDLAVEEFQEFLASNPDHAKAHNNLGIVLSGHGKYSEAIHHFSEALRIRPGDEETQRNMLLVRQKMKTGQH